MATVTLTIPESQASRVIGALCAAAGLPVSPANAKQSIIDHIKTTVRNIETAPPPPPPPVDTEGIVS